MARSNRATLFSPRTFRIAEEMLHDFLKRGRTGNQAGARLIDLKVEHSLRFAVNLGPGALVPRLSVHLVSDLEKRRPPRLKTMPRSFGTQATKLNEIRGHAARIAARRDNDVTRASERLLQLNLKRITNSRGPRSVLRWR